MSNGENGGGVLTRVKAWILPSVGGVALTLASLTWSTQAERIESVTVKVDAHEVALAKLQERTPTDAPTREVVKLLISEQVGPVRAEITALRAAMEAQGKDVESIRRATERTALAVEALATGRRRSVSTDEEDDGR